MAEVDKLPIDDDEVATYASYRKKWAIELSATIPGVVDVVAEAEKICRYIWPHQFNNGLPLAWLGLSPELEKQRPEFYAHLRRTLHKVMIEEMAGWKSAR